MIVIVKDLEHGDDQHEESDALVIRPLSAEDEQLLLQQHPPLHFDLTLKASKTEDDHTDDTCEISSRSSSHEDGREIRPCHQTKDADGHTSMPEWMHDLMWLAICFFGIMISFVAYGILLEYTTSGERRLHERTCSPPTNVSASAVPVGLTHSLLSLCFVRLQSLLYSSRPFWVCSRPVPGGAYAAKPLPISPPVDSCYSEP